MRAADLRYPPIGSYGFLSDCHTSALVSYAGVVEWLCLPRFDSPAVFAALLDRGAGQFSLGPRGVVVPLSRRYEPGTLVIETTWVTETGWVVVHDALTIGRWSTQEGDGPRPRTRHEADRSLLRLATCVDGEAELEMECLPRFGYGREAARWSGGELGAAIACDGEGENLRSARGSGPVSSASGCWRRRAGSTSSPRSWSRTVPVTWATSRRHSPTWR